MLLDGYIRVSQVGGRSGEGFISAALQREQIETWIKMHGADLGNVYEELDQSGARRDRPMLSEALERVESGGSQGIVVAKLDRFSRSVIDGLASIERITAAGGTFVSVQDGLDVGTPTGNLILQIMLSMAEWELERVRANWNSARAHAIARGIHPCAQVPIGYRRGSDRRLEIDPTSAPLIVELFKRRGEGTTYADLAVFLSGKGARTSRGGSHFKVSSISGIIANRVYLGEARCGVHVNPDAHPALVELASWQQAQLPRKIRGRPSRSLLGGFLRCGACRMSMYTQAPTETAKKAQTYRCVGHSSAGKCPGRATVKCEEIEPLVEEFVIRFASQAVPRVDRAQLRRRVTELDRAREELAGYRDAPGLRGTLGDGSFQTGLAKRQRTLERASLALAAAERAGETPELVPKGQLDARWPNLDLEQRRNLISRHVECIFIEPGTAPISERAHVCAPGIAPIDIPRRGVPLGEIRPFEAANAESRTLSPLMHWGARRLEAELKQFLDGRDAWPHYNDFARSGQSRLHQQAMQWGGSYYWSSRLGVEIASRVAHWSEERIANALAPLLAGSTVWPSFGEFRDAGMLPVRKAVIQRGGISHWARKFGVNEREITSE